MSNNFDLTNPLNGPSGVYNAPNNVQYYPGNFPANGANPNYTGNYPANPISLDNPVPANPSSQFNRTSKHADSGPANLANVNNANASFTFTPPSRTWNYGLLPQKP